MKLFGLVVAELYLFNVREARSWHSKQYPLVFVFCPVCYGTLLVQRAVNFMTLFGCNASQKALNWNTKVETSI